MDVDSLFRQAMALHMRGELAQAEPLYRKILARVPNHFDALHLLGVLGMQAGHAAAAIELIRKALEINPRHPGAHSNLANALIELGRPDEALASYERALALKPDYPEALNNRGNALLALKQPAEALASYERALAFKPDYPEALSNRGNALLALKRPAEALASLDRALALNPVDHETLSNRGSALLALKRPAEALASLERALAVKPDDHQALYNRATALLDLKRPDEALGSLERALAIKPDFFEAHYNRGNALKELQRHADALASFEHALALKPDDHETLNNRGSALNGLRRHAEALASYDRALALKPDYAEAHYNRGVALQALKKPAEALASYESAIAFKPDYAEALNNRGNVLNELKRPAEALASYAQALALKADYAEAHWNASLCRLRMGDFAAGWREFEWGWQCGERGKPRRDLARPLWLGKESLQGKTLLLHAEQGLGDTIQFCRYAPLAAARGATVLMEVQPALKPLLAGLAGVSQLLCAGDRLPAFDYHCPLLSLPLAFDTRLDTIPAAIPYLRSDPARAAAWRRRLGDGGKPRVGLVWSGNAAQRNDPNRSMPLSDLVPLIAADIEFVSLQKDVRATDRPVLDAQRELAHFGDELNDFADTAALLEHMDVVVTVCTSVAHLAGAMGKPVWIMLAFNADYRWLLDREDSPWYPSARLFRQPASGDWQSVVARVKHELQDRFGTPASRPPR